MANKNHKRKQKTKTSEIKRKLDRMPPIKSEKPIEFNQYSDIKSNSIFYLLLFSAFLLLTFFIFYFLRSLDVFSYMVSFYSPKTILVHFFVASFIFVIICLISALFFTNIFENRKSPGTFVTVFLGLNAVIMTLIVYPITSGYNATINYPMIAIMLFIIDLVIEIGLLIFGIKIFKKIELMNID